MVTRLQHKVFKFYSSKNRFQFTVKSGREGQDMAAQQPALSCEKLGAAEILLNCTEKNGCNSGLDIKLINHTRNNVTIPVNASSGAGKMEHFREVFEKTDVEAAWPLVSSSGKKFPSRRSRNI